MIPRSTRGLAKLSRRCQTAIVTLVDFVRNRAQKFGELRAWGQFLDAEQQEGQIGIYGTTAAIRILAESSFEMVRPTLAILPGLSMSNPEDSNLLLDPTDLDLTYKLVCILNAVDPETRDLPAGHPAEARLTGMCIEGRGWGYHGRENAPDPTPSVLPTSLALLALSRSQAFIHSPTLDTAADWLIDELAKRSELPAFHQALGLLAIVRLEARIGARPNYKQTRGEIINRLAKWTEGRTAVLVQYDEHVHYYVPEPQTVNGRNHYAFFPPDVIVAWALLKAGNSPKTRSYVLSVVQAVCRDVELHQAFKSRATGRSAASDALWTYELLRSFRAQYGSDQYMLLGTTYSHLSGSKTRRGLALAGGTVVAGVPSYFSFQAGGPLLDTFAAVWLTLVGGFVAAMVFSWSQGSGA